mmetsp:Transcript_131918/g.242661  ORF Transcript_131918/g.242661 Transcript_131918/m.242661 type:complete len:214 (+) Transcript_131918:74-715(+)
MRNLEYGNIVMARAVADRHSCRPICVIRWQGVECSKYFCRRNYNVAVRLPLEACRSSHHKLPCRAGTGQTECEDEIVLLARSVVSPCLLVLLVFNRTLSDFLQKTITSREYSAILHQRIDSWTRPTALFIQFPRRRRSEIIIRAEAPTPLGRLGKCCHLARILHGHTQHVSSLQDAAAACAGVDLHGGQCLCRDVSWAKLARGLRNFGTCRRT